MERLMHRKDVPDDLVSLAMDGMAARDIRACLAAVLPEHERQVRATFAASLRRAAEGRLEYARSCAPGTEEHTLLTRSAAYYESTALIIEDPRHVMTVIPSWRWTDEETASLYPERGEGQ